MKLIVTVLCTLLIHYVLPQTGCPIKKPQLLSNTTSEGSGISLGEVSYEAYLYICLSMGAGQPSQWTPVCGGEHWTNREAKVACHQLGYPNTTTIAVTGGICSIPPAVTQAGVEVSRCSGTETTLEDCQLASTNCNNWGGVICTSLAYCPQEICHNTSYCHPSSTCSNCTTPPELNCICYTECDPPCSNGGSCSYNNTCQCTPNWTGQHCEQDLLTMTTMKPLIPSPCSKECQNGGNCSIGGYCTCTGNWTGSFCEEAVCSPGFCLNGGRCLYPNIRCTCLTGYGGSRCESNNGKNWASTAGPNTVILSASITAATLFGILTIFITAAIILKCRLMRKNKTKTKSRSIHINFNNVPSKHRNTDMNAEEKLKSFFLQVSNISYNVFQREEACRKENVKEHLTYETITLNNVNSTLNNVNSTLNNVNSTLPSAWLKEDSVNIYDYADVNITINEK